MVLDRRALILAAAITMPTAAAAEQAYTTRIETRPFYGATVTLEHGVRVFRALPAHDRVIINPGGQTPLQLGFEQHRHYNYNHNYNYDRGDGGYAPGDAGYLPGTFHGGASGHRGFRHRAGGHGVGPHFRRSGAGHRGQPGFHGAIRGHGGGHHGGGKR